VASTPLRRPGGQPQRRIDRTSCANRSRLHSIYSVTFSPLYLAQTNDLKPPETGAAFLFCNISTVETSLWACGPSDRPQKFTALAGIATLRAQGVGWKWIAAEMGVGVGTPYRVALEGSKIRQKAFLNLVGYRLSVVGQFAI
jgi:hypothetical protein